MIEPLLPGAEGKRSRGRPTENDRQVLNGIFYVMRTGIPWRDLPERYGPYTTIYNRFNRHDERLMTNWKLTPEGVVRRDGRRW